MLNFNDPTVLKFLLLVVIFLLILFLNYAVNQLPAIQQSLVKTCLTIKIVIEVILITVFFHLIHDVYKTYYELKDDSAKVFIGTSLVFGCLLVFQMIWDFIQLVRPGVMSGFLEPKPREENSPLEGNLDLLFVCNDLQSLVVENASIIQKSNLISDVNELVQDLKDGILRIYFFGHQNAGKSSLINALLNVSEVSPTFPGKLTACLIRIRWGLRLKIVAHYQNGAKHSVNSISNLKTQMEDWAKLGVKLRKTLLAKHCLTL